MKKVDILIVGGGPAGAMLGHYLKDKNLEYLIIEKGKYCREKVCAGGLPSAIYNVLPNYLHKFIKTPYDTLLVDYKGSKAISSVSKVFAYGVERQKFDEFLRQGLNVIYEEKFLDYEDEKDGLLVKTDKEVYKCKFLVGADGVGSAVSIKSGIGKKTKFIVAEERDVPYEIKDKNITRIYLGYNFLGYGWLWAKEQSFSVGSGTIKGHFKPRTVDKFDKNIEIPPKVFPIAVWDGSQKLTKGRIALVGEAGALVDPFNAAGIYTSILSSFLLSETLEKKLKVGSYSLEEYNDTLSDQLYSGFNYASALSKIFYPLIPFVKSIALKESTLNLLVKLASEGYISYKEIFERVSKSKYLNLKIAYGLLRFLQKI